MQQFKRFMLLFSLLSLAGCTLLGNKTPSVRSLTLTITVSQNANLSLLHTASPIAISVYPLNRINSFYQATYQQIQSKPQDIANGYAWIVWPNQSIQKHLSLAPGTNAIGIVAHYRHLANKVWKVTQQLHWYTQTVDITITRYGIEEH